MHAARFLPVIFAFWERVPPLRVLVQSWSTVTNSWMVYVSQFLFDRAHNRRSNSPPVASLPQRRYKFSF